MEFALKRSKGSGLKNFKGLGFKSLGFKHSLPPWSAASGETLPGELGISTCVSPAGDFCAGLGASSI